MTIIFEKEKVIILKTVRTGSTSLQEYYSFNPDVKITTYNSGHEPLNDLKKSYDFNECDFKFIFIYRNQIEYVVSLFNKIVGDKRYNTKMVNIIRWLENHSSKLAFIFFYLIFLRLTEQKYKFKSFTKEQYNSFKHLDLVVLNHKHISELKKYVSFDYEKYKSFKFELFKPNNINIVPKFLINKIKKEIFRP